MKKWKLFESGLFFIFLLLSLTLVFESVSFALPSKAEIKNGVAPKVTTIKPAFMSEKIKEVRRLNPPHNKKSKIDAPDQINDCPAEFDPMKTWLLGWAYGAWTYYPEYNEMFKSLLKEGTKGAPVTILISSESDKDEVLDIASQQNVDSSLILFEYVSTEGIWIRDYGPLTSTDNSYMALIDSMYYPDRIVDDASPLILANNWQSNWYDFAMSFEGGNFMNDGAGTCFMSKGIIEEYNSDYNLAQIEDMFETYLDCRKIIWLKSLPGDGTGHIDVYAKLLDSTTIILADFPEDQSNSEWDMAMEENLATLNAATNLNGDSFTVERIMYSNRFSDEYGTFFKGYTNSLIVNNVVMVPTYGESAYDAQALTVYKSLMPDHTVVGIDSTDFAPLGGAIHCITMQVPDLPMPPETNIICETDFVIENLPFSNTDDTTGDNGDFNISTSCGYEWGFGAEDHKYELTLEAKTIVDITVTPANNTYDPGVIITNTCLESSACVYSSDYGEEGGAEEVIAELEGGTYYIIVDSGYELAGELSHGSYTIEVKVGDELPYNPCDNMPFEGCCDNDTLYWCENNKVQSISCSEENTTCGWDASNEFYNCDQSGADPSGNASISCDGILDDPNGTDGDISVDGDIEIEDDSEDIVVDGDDEVEIEDSIDGDDEMEAEDDGDANDSGSGSSCQNTSSSNALLLLLGFLFIGIRSIRKSMV